MNKTILITGSTDGIGLETAKMLRSEGTNLLLHGRNAAKLEKMAHAISALDGTGVIETYVADLSRMSDVVALAQAIIAKHQALDVVINNAGVFKIDEPVLDNGRTSDLL